jgi:hypothetical protein
MLLRGYRKLAAGQRLVDVIEVFRSLDRSQYDDQCRPRLAFARATATYCQFQRISGNGSARFTDLPGKPSKRKRHEFPGGTFLHWDAIGHSHMPVNYWSRHEARVPLIPTCLRPRKAIDSYFILFEAEWKPIPPKDPLLLRQLHEDIYVIVAEWNLTELERAVLQGMMRKEQTT